MMKSTIISSYAGFVHFKIRCSWAKYRGSRITSKCRVGKVQNMFVFQTKCNRNVMCVLYLCSTASFKVAGAVSYKEYIFCSLPKIRKIKDFL